MIEHDVTVKVLTNRLYCKNSDVDFPENLTCNCNYFNSEEEEEDDEINEVDVEALFHYIEDEDSAKLPTSSVREGTELVEEQPIYPTQDSLSNEILKRIIMGFDKHHNIDIATKFKTVDFQIFTPNRIVLEKQTIQRICQTPNVLPKHIADMGTFKEGK